MSRMRDLINRNLTFVTLNDLFPGIKNSNFSFKLPTIYNLSDFCEEIDYFLPEKTKQSKNKTTSQKTNKERVKGSTEYAESPIYKFNTNPSPIYKSKTNQKLVNARWFTIDENGNNIKILLQWKLKKKGFLKINEVISLQDYFDLKKRYSNFTLYFILITTAKVLPYKEMSTTVEEELYQDYVEHVLWVDEKSILNNFSPNIIPYLC